jgi:hypothetical protein
LMSDFRLVYSPITSFSLFCNCYSRIISNCLQDLCRHDDAFARAAAEQKIDFHRFGGGAEANFAKIRDIITEHEPNL